MKSKLLLLEDEEHTREVVADYLSEMGYGVVCAADGQQGIKLFSEHKFDLINRDIMLLKSNGFIVLNEIRKTRSST